MKLGDILSAPWGRYVVHRIAPLVLRDLTRSSAFVLPVGELDYTATGETFTPALRPLGVMSEAILPSSVAAPAPLSDAWWMEFVRAPAYEPQGLTLGGQRPGTGTGILPSAPCLWWRPCLTRELAAGETHCWFLAFSNDQTFYCWECRVGRPTYELVPKGVHPELERVWPTEADVAARAAALALRRYAASEARAVRGSCAAHDPDPAAAALADQGSPGLPPGQRRRPGRLSSSRGPASCSSAAACRSSRPNGWRRVDEGVRASGGGGDRCEGQAVTDPSIHLVLQTGLLCIFCSDRRPALSWMRCKKCRAVVACCGCVHDLAVRTERHCS